MPGVGVIERVSVASDGSQGNGASFESAASADGRFVAFDSAASNLVPGDTNAGGDIFVRDTCVGAPAGCTPSTTLVSVASDSAQGNNASHRPSISADGRFVAFHSFASNLVAGDSNGSEDVFVRDTCQGAPSGCTPSTIRASVASDGTEADGRSLRPSLSADGRFVAFESAASNLVPGDSNGFPDIFLRDTCVGGPAGCTPSTIRVSVASDGTQGNASSGGFSRGGSFVAPSLSGDGRFVAFMSAASNLVAGDTNSFPDTFLRDTCVGGPLGCTPSTVRVSVASDGTQGNGESARLSISANGRFVAFRSQAENLVADGNDREDVFVRDTCEGAPSGCTPSTIRASVASDGTECDRACFRPSLGADGRLVAFSANATTLVPSDINGFTDIFLRDTCVGGPLGCTPSTVRVSVASDGSEGNNGSDLPSLSANGRFVAFTSDASNLVGGDTNSVDDILIAATGFAGPTNPLPTANFLTLIPHSAVGGGYLTRLLITNLTATSNAITINRITQSGSLVSSTASTLPAAGTVQVVDSESLRTGTITINWFAIGSALPVAASALFDFEGSSVGLSADIRQAVGALAAPSLSAFTAPVWFDPTTFATIGLALANPNNASTTVTMKLIDANGTVVATDSTLTLAAFTQTAFVVSNRAAFSSLVAGGFLGSLAVTTADSNLPVSALVVGGVGNDIFSLPVVSGTAR